MKVSCILMRWSDSPHLGQGTSVCGLDIEICGGLGPYNEQV